MVSTAPTEVAELLDVAALGAEEGDLASGEGEDKTTPSLQADTLHLATKLLLPVVTLHQATRFLSTLKRNLVAMQVTRPETQLSTCCSSPSPASLVRTTPSTPKSLRLPLSATVKSMEVTTLTPRLSAKLSTSALLTEQEVWPSTASSVPTEPSSTRTTSSATGGSTSTAPPPRISGV